MAYSRGGWHGEEVEARCFFIGIGIGDCGADGACVAVMRDGKCGAVDVGIWACRQQQKHVRAFVDEFIELLRSGRCHAVCEVYGK